MPGVSAVGVVTNWNQKDCRAAPVEGISGRRASPFLVMDGRSKPKELGSIPSPSINRTFVACCPSTLVLFDLRFEKGRKETVCAGRFV